ncbi:MAG TPA: DRTGG domain-containing protein [Bacteroidales bacterium]|nr:DRTGG domain-containing protein [Bacteroidales bacterium]
MNVRELQQKLSLTVFCGGRSMEYEVSGGYTCDLLSDVMGHARSGNVWITLQTHQNVVAIASLKELPAIVLVKGFNPDTGMMEHAEKEGIAILGTDEDSFTVSGRIYQLLVSR